MPKRASASIACGDVREGGDQTFNLNPKPLIIGYDNWRSDKSTRDSRAEIQQDISGSHIARHHENLEQVECGIIEVLCRVEGLGVIGKTWSDSSMKSARFFLLYVCGMRGEPASEIVGFRV